MMTGRNIAIVGANGNLGRPVLRALFTRGVHRITAIQRQESAAKFPAEIIVKRGDLTNESFLVETLEGQDVLIIIVPIPNMELGDVIVKAAIKAQVPYILPTEFGIDSPLFVGEHHIMAPKVARRKVIEESKTSSWIAVISNFWLNLNIQYGLWGFDFGGRRAEILTDANAKVSTTTLARTRESTAALLSLAEAELSQYRNKSFYISSFELAQKDIFEALKVATKTTDADWTVAERHAEDVIRECEPKIREGNGYAEWKRLFVKFFQGVHGSNYEDKAVDLSRLGVPSESLDDVVRQVVE